MAEQPYIRFEQKYAPGHVLELRGSAMPKADSASWSDESMLSTRHYGSRSAQYQFGFHNGKVSLGGVWNDQKLAQDFDVSLAGWYSGAMPTPVTSSRNLRHLLGELQRDGVLIEMTTSWGERWVGRIESVNYSQGRHGELRWDLNFEPTSGESSPEDEGLGGALPGAGAFRKDKIFGVFEQLEAAPEEIAKVASDTFNLLEWVETSVGNVATFVQDILDIMNGMADLLEEVNEIRDQAISILNNGMAQLASLANRLVQGAMSWEDAAVRVGSIGTRMRDQALALEESLRPESEYGHSDDPYEQHRASELMSSVAETGRAMGCYLAYLDAWLKSYRAAESSSDYDSYEVKRGDTLRSIAGKYGNPDLWWTIADENGISSDVELIVGRRITIPVRRLSA